jgi:hypothetical protein
MKYPPIIESTPLTPWGELAKAEPPRTLEEALRDRWSHIKSARDADSRNSEQRDS